MRKILSLLLSGKGIFVIKISWLYVLRNKHPIFGYYSPLPLITLRALFSSTNDKPQ